MGTCMLSNFLLFSTRCDEFYEDLFHGLVVF